MVFRILLRPSVVAMQCLWMCAPLFVCERCRRCPTELSPPPPPIALIAFGGRRWHRAVHSGTLSSSDRRPLPICDSDRLLAPKSLPPSLYESKAAQWSLGQDKLDHLLDEKRKDWGSYRGDGYHLMAHAGGLMCDCHRTARWSDIDKAFLALLAEPRTVLHHKKNGCTGLVLESSSYGVVMWSLEPLNMSGLRWWRPCIGTTDGAQVFRQVTLVDPSDWVSIEIEPVPPAVLASKYPGVPAILDGGMALLPTSSPEPLVKAAARLAFKRMNTMQLRLLAPLLDIPVPSPQPKSEYEWCRLLVSSVLDPIDPSEVDKLIDEFRGRAARSTWSTMLTENDASLVDGLLDADDVKEVRQAVVEKAAAAKKRSDAQKAPAKGPRAPRKMAIAEQQEYTADFGRQFIPKVKGCSLSKDEALHYRFKISYPTGAPPYSTSCAWSSGVSQRQALMHCLRWAWDHHTRVTGERPPHTFDE